MWQRWCEWRFFSRLIVMIATDNKVFWILNVSLTEQKRRLCWWAIARSRYGHAGRDVSWPPRRSRPASLHSSGTSPAVPSGWRHLDSPGHSTPQSLCYTSCQKPCVAHTQCWTQKKERVIIIRVRGNPFHQSACTTSSLQHKWINHCLGFWKHENDPESCKF